MKSSCIGVRYDRRRFGLATRRDLGSHNKQLLFAEFKTFVAQHSPDLVRLLDALLSSKTGFGCSRNWRWLNHSSPEPGID